MEKNKLIYPANGIVLKVDFLFNKRCKANEKIMALTNKMIKDTVEKANESPKKSKMSPKPMASKKDIFNFNLEYKKTMSISMETKRMFMEMALKNSSGNVSL